MMIMIVMMFNNHNSLIGISKGAVSISSAAAEFTATTLRSNPIVRWICIHVYGVDKVNPYHSVVSIGLDNDLACHWSWLLVLWRLKRTWSVVDNIKVRLKGFECQLTTWQEKCPSIGVIYSELISSSKPWVENISSWNTLQNSKIYVSVPTFDWQYK